jgi:dimethylhistidine N-methyltransferase
MNDTILLPQLSPLQHSCDGFLSEVIAGLSRPQKMLPCKFLYDGEGSGLFNEICELEEYYPTRTENQILRDNINEIAALIGSECRLVEFGSGNSAKTRHLLSHLPGMCGYIPIDISGPQLLESADQLAAEFPGLEINPLEADYEDISEIPATKRKPKRTVAFFPGSTIGNFDPVAAIAFLRKIAFLCGHDGGLLIGVDRQKSKQILEPAYNDRKGITARFNLGILARVNRELGADFDLTAFRHRAPYNETHGRIEMHLVSERAQTVHLDSRKFKFEQGEYITTEYSYKYTLPGFAGLAFRAGFELVRNWEDRNRLFSVLFLRVRNRKLSQKKVCRPSTPRPAKLAKPRANRVKMIYLNQNYTQQPHFNHEYHIA